MRVDFGENQLTQRALAVAGIVFVLLGLLALISEGIPYPSRKTLALPPLVGLVAISGGVLLLIRAVRRIA
jgi:uncharacterized membrane protein HdeD (DUF308 family)